MQQLGSKSKLSDEQWQEIKELFLEGKSIPVLANHIINVFGISISAPGVRKAIQTKGWVAERVTQNIEEAKLDYSAGKDKLDSNFNRTIDTVCNRMEAIGRDIDALEIKASKLEPGSSQWKNVKTAISQLDAKYNSYLEKYNALRSQIKTEEKNDKLLNAMDENAKLAGAKAFLFDMEQRWLLPEPEKELA